MSAQEFDVIIIGAGPGGSTAAHTLARAGRRVLAIDRAEFPRVKICAGWITPGAMRLLELSPDEYPHTIQAFSSGSVVLNDHYYETDFQQTASYGIIRQEFDNFLMERARSAGAQILTGERVKTIARNADDIQVTMADGRTFAAPIIIGAGGTHCPVAMQWGEKQKNEAIIVAAESETRIGADTLKQLTPYYGTTELFPEEDFHGYAWYVTKGDWLNIGIGRFKFATESFNQYREAFYEKLKSMGRLRGIEDKLVSFGGHSYKLYDEVPRRISGDRFMLIGDAGGFASQWAGEGIKPAIQTGIYAAENVLQALNENDFGPAAMQRYERRCRQTYGQQKPDIFFKFRSLLPESFKLAMARQICKRDGLRKKLIFETAFGFEPVESGVKS